MIRINIVLSQRSIYIDPPLPNLERGSQQLPIVPETANPELENGMEFRTVHLLVSLA